MNQPGQTLIVEPEPESPPEPPELQPVSNPIGKQLKNKRQKKTKRNPQPETTQATLQPNVTGTSADVTTGNTSWEKTKEAIKEIAREENEPIPKSDEVKESEKKGVEQAIQEEAKNNIKSKVKLQELVTAAPRPLMKIKAVFPFQLFPDEITIEETRVNFAFREFFSSAEYRSVSIADIMEVTVQTAFMFSSLKVVSRTFNPTNMEKLEVTFLKTSDARKARRVIEGLKIAIQQKIDTTQLNVDDLLHTVEELGKEHEVE